MKNIDLEINTKKAWVAFLQTELPRKVLSQVYKRCTGGEMRMVGVHMPQKGQQQPHQVHSIMILPQVHLRKPCYDFYFL